MKEDKVEFYSKVDQNQKTKLLMKKYSSKNKNIDPDEIAGLVMEVVPQK